MSLRADWSLIDELNASATQFTSPCGEGRMVWRRWGTGDPVVLLHGGSGSWRHWVLNIEPLARWREVWCPDLPGMGESDLPPAPGDVHAVGRSVSEGLALLLGPGRRIDLVGFSFGGILGSLMLAAGLAVNRFVIIGSTGLGNPPAGMNMLPWKQETDPQRRAAIHRNNLLAMMLSREESADAVALRMYSEDLARARFNSGKTARSTLLRDALAGTQAQVTGIWGACDATVAMDPSRSRRALQSVVPDLDFHVIPDAGHWAAYENAGAFNEALGKVLRAPLRG